MKRVQIRAIQPADARRAAEIDGHAADDLRKVYRPTDAALLRRSELDQALQGLVAVIEDRVVGVVRYRLATKHLWFLGLGVDPAARRRGVARAMIQHLEGIARTSGCTTIGLHTVRQTGNVEIFRRLGFTVESEAPTDLFVSQSFSELSEVVMRKQVV
jgi:GNAT superfamily N-acetyltransferase